MARDKRIQLKHIADAEIVAACRAYHASLAPTPDVALADRYPPKVILAKMARLVERGVLEYGTSLPTAWPLPEQSHGS